MKLYHGSTVRILKGLQYCKGETFQYAFCTERALKYLKKL